MTGFMKRVRPGLAMTALAAVIGTFAAAPLQPAVTQFATERPAARKKRKPAREAAPGAVHAESRQIRRRREIEEAKRQRREYARFAPSRHTPTWQDIRAEMRQEARDALAG